MAIALIESYSAGFFTQISSQNREVNNPHPTGENYKTEIHYFFNSLYTYLAIN
jgi:hypothetical protein